ncbi:long-chain-fatty-acid--CoA ligase [Reticulibacter mediterranei]|uniref:Long-chain-fatty-acid--CoA ligase n=2 Tax=Reticulibacter mediterranei TaxID=2778369 RepID=A0A8J3IMY4_9CHLR|nr:long-chain-fatty-acid--CoA ligase [Reticulibacter mediterranei]
MSEPKPMTIKDVRVLYDLAIYNCVFFGPYTQVVYENVALGETRICTNIELAQEATQLAGGLRTLGIEKGDRVLVMLPNRPEVLIAYQAIARAGAVIIPVLPLLKPPEVYYIAANSGAKAIVTSTPFLPTLRNALADLSTMRHMIVTDTDEELAGSPHVIPYKTVVTQGEEYADHSLSDLDEHAPTADDMAAILYTSGTTGQAKGVVLTHSSLIANALNGWHGASPDGDPRENFGETHLAILPLAHAYGILMLDIAYLSGVKIVMHPRFDVHAVLSAIERHRITFFAGVPAMFVALLYTPDADSYDTSSLRNCGSGSAPLPMEVLKGFEQKFHCELGEGYGLSEASAMLTSHRTGMPRKPGSVGTSIPGVELRIVDENDHEVPTGEVGEIIARGPNVMQGYYNMAEATTETLRNGWLHTGDMGRLDEDGYLYIVERKKDLIIRGGFNIYPRDVEEVLASHPAVIEAAVVGVPSQRMGEEVKAFVVVSSPIDVEALITYCRERLANYKTPSQIEIVDALPRNTIGKIDKKELRKRHVS